MFDIKNVSENVCQNLEQKYHKVEEKEKEYKGITNKDNIEDKADGRDTETKTEIESEIKPNKDDK